MSAAGDASTAAVEAVKEAVSDAVPIPPASALERRPLSCELSHLATLFIAASAIVSLPLTSDA